MLSLLPALILGTALRLLASPVAPPVTRLSGHLAHAPAGDTVRLWLNNRQLKTPLSPGGDFQFELKDLTQNLPTELSYAGQRTKLYLRPGDQLVMLLDFKDFDRTLGYSGKGSEVNNYLAQSLYKYQYGPAAADLPRPQNSLSATPAEIRRLSDAYRQSRLATLASYAKAHPLPADFVHDEQVTINTDWATTLLMYASRYEPAPGAPGLPESFYGFLREVPLAEASRHFGRGLVDNSLVANLVMGYQYRLTPTGRLSTDPAEGPRLYQLATAELGDTKARDWVMEALLLSNTRTNLPGALAFYPTFRQHNRDSALARVVRTTFAQRRQLDAGQPAPAFTLTDNTGKPVSLADLKGKVVYLDFWGTWCPPCMREMTEFAPALKKQFEGRDVVFLYISVGDAEAKWQQTLADKHFTSPNSVHLRAPNSSLAASYLVNGYPTYYLIGRDGRFITAYASRPSDGPATVAAIEAALKR